MTKKSWIVFGVCALTGAVVEMRRRMSDVRVQAARESARCERLLKGLDARCANFR